MRATLNRYEYILPYFIVPGEDCRVTLVVYTYIGKKKSLYHTAEKEREADVNEFTTGRQHIKGSGSLLAKKSPIWSLLRLVCTM